MFKKLESFLKKKGKGKIFDTVTKVVDGILPGEPLSVLRSLIEEDPDLTEGDLEQALELFKLEIEDTQDARNNETLRDTNKDSSWLSKNIHEIIAIQMMFCWIAIIVLVLWLFVKKYVTMNEAVLLIGITGVKDMISLILGYMYGKSRPSKE